ncbi:hypothetical protein [Streptomyces sp. NPDC102437]|uniref:hypothetical protein n=1 Tax=Streptomyces sp. NPDC102437 TaxID=3366175 RepID=UPI0037F99049
MTVQGAARVQVSNHQYVLLDTDAEEPGQDIDGTLAGNGLVSTNAESTYATVLTGTSYGHVDIAFDVTAYPAPP